MKQVDLTYDADMNASLPARERGLKPIHANRAAMDTLSLPARERGLKQQFLHLIIIVFGSSLPARERGLKQYLAK